MFSNQHIILNSKTATEKNTYGNKAVFQLQRPIYIPSNLECNISLKSFSYANTFYNITEKTNILYTTLGNITITPGSHTIYTILNALNNNNLGITFSYDVITFRITAVCNTNFQIIDGLTSLHSKIGYQTPTAVSTTLVAQNVVSLQGVNSIQVQLQNLNIESNSVVGGLDSIIAFVPNNISSGSINMFLPTTSHNYKINVPFFNTINVSLYDDNSEDLDFQGHGWEMSMFISFQYIRKYVEPESLLRPLTAPTLQEEPTKETTKKEEKAEENKEENKEEIKDN